jgi:translocation and assembly module TamB
VRGDARIDWSGERFETSADVHGEVAPGKKAPVIAAKLHASGDRETLSVDALTLEIPGASARLSDPVAFSRKNAGATRSSRFAVEIDLAKQPWLEGARGRLSGKAEVISTSAGWPHIEATLEAQELAVSDWSIARFSTMASFEWPRFSVKEAVLGFAEGGQLTLHGGWDFKTNEVVDAVADGVIRPSVIARWLPEKIAFESLKIAAKARGPLKTLQHEGNAQITALVVPGINPLAVELAWRGAGPTLKISEAQFAAGNSRITLAGEMNATSAQVTALKFFQGQEERLILSQPANFRWSPRVEVDALALTGTDASLTVALSAGSEGRFDLRARNIKSSWASDFTALPGPEWQLASLEAQGEWSGGPIVFSTRAEVAMTLAPERTANVSLVAQGGARGIKIESLQVLEGTTPIVNATGQLPLTLHPGGQRLMELEPDAPLTLHATTASDAEFWAKLADATGLEFQNPEVSAELSGTWSHPKGDVSAKAGRVAFDPRRVKFSFPLVEALDLHATADGKGVNLDRLSLQVEKQSLSASGSVAFNFKQWDEFKRAPITFLRREGSAHLVIPQAEIGAFTKYLPAFFAPAGSVQVDATIKPGGEMTGVLRLNDAATRPLGPLGVLQEIHAEAELSGRTIEVKSLVARAGGQPVTLTGKVQLPLDAPPKYDFALKGENLPLVRQTGLLLRADLDLKLVTQSDNVPEVSGVVNLRDSMFLSDVRAFLPRGGGGGPTRRPPFFAVEDPPVNAWRLGVEVRGEKFLRLRSTVFVGVASAHFRLSGTLGDPRAIGEVAVESGQVLLPFAAFQVEQGTVRLTEADPYELRLFVSGTSRRYGYDLRMELTGTATVPIITFSSSPPLESRQVLMMVTTGETPQNEITYSTTQRVTRLGTYLGQSLVNNFGGDASEADRLSIDSGERVSRNGRETYEIEYRLSERFSLVGEYDEFDDYNAGVKWRLLAPHDEAKKTTTDHSTSAEKKELPDAPKR